ncbi:hypothetical protein EJ02DRAFT_482698 [Clathrospora elynae]|uniref:Uncharacterized protein n=1 Tax=Clathrospora elynae TaxID=706981 RepID=A0A6A5S7H1_9PLEO|nr:hypothetical protein EJ02DRAFT_482698 [Clathrospora elynae]
MSNSVKKAIQKLFDDAAKSKSTMSRLLNPSADGAGSRVYGTPPGTPETMPSMESALRRVKRSTVNRTNSYSICRSTPMQRARRSGTWRRKILIVSFRPPTSTLSKVLRRSVSAMVLHDFWGVGARDTSAYRALIPFGTPVAIVYREL